MALCYFAINKSPLTTIFHSSCFLRVFVSLSLPYLSLPLLFSVADHLYSCSPLLQPFTFAVFQTLSFTSIVMPFIKTSIHFFQTLGVPSLIVKGLTKCCTDSMTAGSVLWQFETRGRISCWYDTTLLRCDAVCCERNTPSLPPVNGVIL